LITGLGFEVLKAPRRKDAVCGLTTRYGEFLHQAYSALAEQGSRPACAITQDAEKFVGQLSCIRSLYHEMKSRPRKLLLNRKTKRLEEISLASR